MVARLVSEKDFLLAVGEEEDVTMFGAKEEKVVDSDVCSCCFFVTLDFCGVVVVDLLLVRSYCCWMTVAEG